MWGWNVDDKTAFRFLDMYYQSGGRYIDTAYNYPINGVKEDLCYAVRVISEWIRVNNVDDLKVIFKFGSVDNSKTSENDLSVDRTREMYLMAKEYLGANLYSLMVHWDNRIEYKSIEETVRCLALLSQEYSFNIGLSGIKELNYYRDLIIELGISSIDHEIKHAFNSDELTSIGQGLIENYRLWAYGISGSGLKLDLEEYRSDSYVTLVRKNGFHEKNLSCIERESIKQFIEASELVSNLYEYSMLIKENDPRFYGYIVSPSRVSQLEQIIDFKYRFNTLKADG